MPNKLLFICISEMQPTFEAKPQSYFFPSHSDTFSDYLTDSYHFQGLKGSTSCYFMRIICLFHSHTPSLSPSPARGIFRLGDMVLDVSFRLMCFVHSLPSFNLKAHSYVNSQTMNQLATVIIPTCIKRFDKVSFIIH